MPVCGHCRWSDHVIGIGDVGTQIYDNLENINDITTSEVYLKAYLEQVVIPVNLSCYCDKTFETNAIVKLTILWDADISAGAPEIDKFEIKELLGFTNDIDSPTTSLQNCFVPKELEKGEAVCSGCGLDLEYQSDECQFEASEQLWNMDDSDGKEFFYRHWQEVDHLTDLTLPVTVSCHCGTQMHLKVICDVDVDWGHYSDREVASWVNGFDVDITGLAAIDDECDTFVFEKCESLFQKYDDVSLEDITPIVEKERFLHLRIVAKTYMSRGHCYIGFDENQGKLLRPLYKTATNACCWHGKGQSFNVGKSYKFKLLRHPNDDGDPPTPLPHSNEDTVVEECEDYAETNETASDFLSGLRAVARTEINAIFSQVLPRKFVTAKTNTNSVGILRCKEGDIDIFQNHYGKNRCSIRNQVRDIPLTALEYDKPVASGIRDALVVLGLGRPWNNDGKCNPARCYLLVVGIFIC